MQHNHQQQQQQQHPSTNLQNISFQFQICVGLDETEQAVLYLEQIVNFIEEYSLDELEMVNRLTKRIVHQKKKQLNTLITINEPPIGVSTTQTNSKEVLTNYTTYLHNEAITLVIRLLSCINISLSKLTEHRSRALCYKLLGKIHSFLYLYDDNDKSSNLQMALKYYQTAIKLCIKHLDITDQVRMKTYLSYCRFAIVSLKDYYRAMLFCINAKKEIEKEIEGKENVEKVVFVMLDKYEKFINDNIDIYNRVMKIYFPEINNYT